MIPLTPCGLCIYFHFTPHFENNFTIFFDILANLYKLRFQNNVNHKYQEYEIV